MERQELRFIFPWFSVVFILFLGGFGLSFPGCRQQAEKPQVKETEGVRQVINPAHPLKGTVQVEAEKTFELNPYKIPDFNWKYFRVLRDKQQIILYDPNEPAAKIFSKDGAYLGSFIRIGQGPGEFPSYTGFALDLEGDEIWAVGNMKVARFDRRGQLLGEFKIPDQSAYFLRPDCYLTDLTAMENNRRVKKLLLKKIDQNGTAAAVELLSGSELGLIRWTDRAGGFSEPYGTDDIIWSMNKAEARIAVALKSNYQLRIFDQDGRKMMEIEVPAERMSVSRQEKEKLLQAVFGKGKSPEEIVKKMLAVYPDQLMLMLKLSYLPGGQLGVFRITAPGRWQLDVFDREGTYLYALAFPDQFLEKWDALGFFESGFWLINTGGDYPVYEEYQIKNCPEIFSSSGR
ncbi:MAG TPA: 6-bladed beta-propeller [Candidatus Saccharicenans sp.]|nr:6-bladed beta-propeller [Candidatus Saccharicenans sp.]HQM74830.1 6-bladed beta-propeller [Candidatus Saccharicenans sp.]